MLDSVARILDVAVVDGIYFGQILVRKTAAGGCVLLHRDDTEQSDLRTFRNAEDAIEIAKYDDAENYRPLKTAPNLRRGWRLEVVDLNEMHRALDYFYPGRLAVFAAWKENRLGTTTLRETLDRQSGMYRVAGKISDAQIDSVVGKFCRSDGGCLRTILWKRDRTGAPASPVLPKEKFDPTYDQTGQAEGTIPLLCQEACNLLVAECRRVVKDDEP